MLLAAAVSRPQSAGISVEFLKEVAWRHVFQLAAWRRQAGKDDPIAGLLGDVLF
jgi:hypothetical protein